MVELLGASQLRKQLRDAKDVSVPFFVHILQALDSKDLCTRRAFSVALPGSGQAMGLIALHLLQRPAKVVDRFQVLRADNGTVRQTDGPLPHPKTADLKVRRIQIFHGRAQRRHLGIPWEAGGQEPQQGLPSSAAAGQH
eukprot:Skav222224  [mRNA]  locus=scaffold552:519069:524784:- [translate_table: standard]